MGPDTRKVRQSSRRCSRLVWYLKQLLPLTYWTIWSDDEGGTYFHIWKMWFGRVYNDVSFLISE